MKITEHIDALQREGRRIAAAATRTELDAPIPTCPDWRMRDLVRHVGGVHRWATGYVGNRHTEMLDVDLDDLVDTWPADDLDLIDWFREGHTRLVHTLASAPPDLDCFTFLAAPSPLAMWPAAKLMKRQCIGLMPKVPAARSPNFSQYSPLTALTSCCRVS